MIAVIQCAGSKQHNAGYLKTKDGRPISFVANPKLAPPREDHVYAHPDQSSDFGGSWRDMLLKLNQCQNNVVGLVNADELVSASELYRHAVYRKLVTQLGSQNTYILSAGWGLINSAFLTPYYDITFSSSAETYARRLKRDTYEDFCALPEETEDTVVFFGGKDYLPLFLRLTRSVKNRKVVFYNSAEPPSAPSYSFRRFTTKRRTNWHYECAEAFLGGNIMMD